MRVGDVLLALTMLAVLAFFIAMLMGLPADHVHLFPARRLG